MPTTWIHPQLGRLSYRNGGWSGVASATGFDQFSFSGFARDVGTPHRAYRLCIAAASANDAPPAAGIDVALTVLAQQEELVPTIAAALWAEINGRGPDSQMGWYNARNKPADAGSPFKKVPLETSDDFLKLMRLTEILITRSITGCTGYVAHLRFEAKFKEEHDLGVLTDGYRVLGIGDAENPSVYR